MALVEDSFCESEMYCVNNTHVCSCAVVSKNRNPAAVTPAFFNLFCPPFFNADVVAVVNPAARNNACASNRPLTLDPGLVNASLAPVSVSNRSSHLDFAYALSVVRSGTLATTSASVAAASSPPPSSPSNPTNPRSNARRIFFATDSFATNRDSSPSPPSTTNNARSLAKRASAAAVAPRARPSSSNHVYGDVSSHPPSTEINRNAICFATESSARSTASEAHGERA